MTDEEFELLDELYFVISFIQLQKVLVWEKTRLLEALASALSKGWVKCLDKQDNTLEILPKDLSAHYETCLFLATKEGLQTHNSR
jgi:hypothetical protein